MQGQATPPQFPFDKGHIIFFNFCLTVDFSKDFDVDFDEY